MNGAKTWCSKRRFTALPGRLPLLQKKSLEAFRGSECVNSRELFKIRVQMIARGRDVTHAPRMRQWRIDITYNKFRRQSSSAITGADEGTTTKRKKGEWGKRTPHGSSMTSCKWISRRNVFHDAWRSRCDSRRWSCIYIATGPLELSR